MDKQKTKLYIIGSTVIGIAALLLVYFILVSTGVIHLTQNKLVFVADNADKVYDGTPLEHDGWHLAEGKLQRGHKVQAVVEGNVTLPGQVPNKVHITILDRRGNDVTEEYSIECLDGTLTVFGLPLVLESASAQKVYDGTPLSSDQCVLVSGDLLNGHELSFWTSGSITEVGTVSNLIHTSITDKKTGKDVSYYYTVYCNTGTLTVVSEESQLNGSASAQTGDINEPLMGEPGKRVRFSLYSDIDVDRILFRQKSYGDYTGNGWEKDFSYKGSVDPLAFTASALQNSQYQTDELTVKMKAVCGALTPYYFVEGSMEELAKSTKLDSEYNAFYISYDYLDAATDLRLPDQYLDAEKEYRAFVNSHYLALPESTKQAMLEIAEEQGIASVNDREEQILTVKDYIQNAAAYNLYFSAYPEGVDTAVYFLTDAKEGVCRHFATSAVAMYRALGIPARYTVGYAADASAEAWVDVTEMNGHAWVEVYIDGLGWITVDPTGYSSTPGGDGPGGDGPGGDGPGGDGPGGDGPGGDGPGGDGSGAARPDDTTGDINDPSNDPSIGENKDDLVFVFSPDADGSFLFRQISYGDYVMNGWEKDFAYDSMMPGVDPLFFTTYALSHSDYSINSLSLQMAMDCGYITPYYYMSGTMDQLAEDFDPETLYSAHYYSYDLLKNGTNIKLPLQFIKAEQEYSSFVYANYLSLPEETRTAILKIAEEQGITNISDPLTQIAAVKSYISGAATYNKDYKLYPDDVDTAVYFLTDAKEGVCRHFATSAVAMYRALGIPARYTVGFAASGEKDELVKVTLEDAHAWVEVYLLGIGWVAVDPTGSDGAEEDDNTPPDLILKALSATKVYDGTPLRAEDVGYEIAQGELPEGYRLEVVMKGEINKVAWAKSEIAEYRIFDAADQDVTDQFKVKTESGKLIITPLQLTIEAESVEKIYDGTPLRSQSYTIVEGALLEGHELVNVVFTNSLTEVGKGYINSASYDIVDQNGKSVASCYNLSISNKGILTILPANLTVIAGSATAHYNPLNPQALTCEDFTCVGLPENHTVEVELWGEQDGVGVSENEIVDVRVYDKYGKDVTECFDIQYQNGKLNVLEPV